jgi:hypothetical protein
MLDRVDANGLFEQSDQITADELLISRTEVIALRKRLIHKRAAVLVHASERVRRGRTSKVILRPLRKVTFARITPAPAPAPCHPPDKGSVTHKTNAERQKDYRNRQRVSVTQRNGFDPIDSVQVLDSVARVTPLHVTGDTLLTVDSSTETVVLPLSIRHTDIRTPVARLGGDKGVTRAQTYKGGDDVPNGSFSPGRLPLCRCGELVNYHPKAKSVIIDHQCSACESLVSTDDGEGAPDVV